MAKLKVYITLLKYNVPLVVIANDEFEATNLAIQYSLSKLTKDSVIIWKEVKGVHSTGYPRVLGRSLRY